MAILSKEQIYSGNLLLVNAKFALKNTKVDDLVPVDLRFPNILLKREAAGALQRALEKISAGNAIVPVSGYRSVTEQIAIWNDSFKENGELFTRKFVALPDHSEHQTGFAIDLGLNKETIDFICPDFPYEGICDMFRKIAPEYGFIERYTKDKEKITGISHEPWHFRYVGCPHAQIIVQNEFSLEEYIEFIKAYQRDNKIVFEQNGKMAAEIYFMPVAMDRIESSIPTDTKYQISGNNVDGFIVTVWRKNNEQK